MIHTNQCYKCGTSWERFSTISICPTCPEGKLISEEKETKTNCTCTPGYITCKACVATYSENKAVKHGAENNVQINGCPHCGHSMAAHTDGQCPKISVAVCGPVSAIKYDGEKNDLALLPIIGLEKVGAVMTFGKKKYAAHNWRGGISYSRLLSAALRHTFAYIRGESIDKESGQSHLAHAVCCLLMVLEFETVKPELDDRYTK